MKIPTKEQIQWLEKQYPVGTRVVLRAHGRPSGASPWHQRHCALCGRPGADRVEWDNGSSLSLIPGKDHFHKEASKKNRDEVSR